MYCGDKNKPGEALKAEPNKGKPKMKKLMIAATAALCATLGYSEITSSNVVG